MAEQTHSGNRLKKFARFEETFMHRGPTKQEGFSLVLDNEK